MAEIIQLTKTSRLSVVQDDVTEPPRGRDFGALTGFVKIPELGDSRLIDPPAVHEPPAPVGRIFNHLRWRKGVPAHTDILYRSRAAAAEQTIRAVRILTGLEMVFDARHGGFWFRHYDEDEFGDRTAQLEDIAADRAVYEQWAEGGVYIVTLQRHETYVRVQDSGSDYISDAVDWNDQIERWDDVFHGSLGGCYLDEEYTAQSVALEHFTMMTADERAGAEGKFPAGDLDDD